MAVSKHISFDVREVMSKARKLGESYSSSSFVLALETLLYLNLMLDKQEELNRMCAGEEGGKMDVTFPFGEDLMQGTVEVVHGKVKIKRYLKIAGTNKSKEVFQYVNAIVGMPHFRDKIKRAREAETWSNLQHLTSDDKLFFTEMIEGARRKDRSAAKKRLKQVYKELGYDIDEDSLDVFTSDEEEG